VKKRPKRVHKKLTKREAARLKTLREKIAEEMPEIKARALSRREQRTVDWLASSVEVERALRYLRSERRALGLSLADIRERTGIGKSALSRLENDESANPTIATLSRYADALGKEVRIVLVEKRGRKDQKSASSDGDP